MVDPLDPGTIAMFAHVKRNRGRPRKADALSPAERARRYRFRRKVQSAHSVPEAPSKEALRERDAAWAQVADLRAELERLKCLLDRDVTK